MNYAEVIKHLKNYSDGISGMHEDFDPGLQETCVNAIDLIGRQKAEIESWQGGYMTQKQEIANLETELKAMRGAANSYKAEIERLRESRDRWRKIAEDFDRFSREEERAGENDA